MTLILAAALALGFAATIGATIAHIVILRRADRDIANYQRIKAAYPAHRPVAHQTEQQDGSA